MESYVRYVQSLHSDSKTFLSAQVLAASLTVLALLRLMLSPDLRLVALAAHMALFSAVVASWSTTLRAIAGLMRSIATWNENTLVIV